jgi:hypothetical protein
MVPLVQLSINWRIGWCNNAQKKFIPLQQPSLQLVDNCTSRTIFPPIYKYFPRLAQYPFNNFIRDVLVCIKNVLDKNCGVSNSLSCPTHEVPGKTHLPHFVTDSMTHICNKNNANIFKMSKQIFLFVRFGEKRPFKEDFVLCFFFLLIFNSKWNNLFW